MAVRDEERTRPGREAAAGDKDRFLYTGALGSVQAAKSDNPGRIHALGSIGVSNTDYSRGSFDGIPQDLDILAFPASGVFVFELRGGGDPGTSDVALTVGSGNNLSSEAPPGLAPGSNLRLWYESDHWVGLAAGLPGGWIGGATYSFFASPNDLGGSSQELALAARYMGSGSGSKGLLAAANPQVKLAVPTEDGEGAFTALSLSPSTKLGSGRTLAFPLTLGVGLQDYYGPGTGTSGYVSAGITYSVPLAGAWTVSAGVDAVYRDGDLAALGGPFADHDRLVWDAAVLLKFQY